ncbi:hypothetical protein J1614_004504 [Plenodomus biglobosus]|nr:hypothetical protein J1614_004504 [Plenodomus biglobosus]
MRYELQLHDSKSQEQIQTQDGAHVLAGPHINLALLTLGDQVISPLNRLPAVSHLIQMRAVSIAIWSDCGVAARKSYVTQDRCLSTHEGIQIITRLSEIRQ